MPQNRKPSPPEGAQWVRIDNAHTSTVDDFETRPYQECPNCGEHRYRMLWEYRGGFISWYQMARRECDNCGEVEVFAADSGLYPPVRRFRDFVRGVLGR